MKCPKCGADYKGTACPQCGYLTPPPVLAEGSRSSAGMFVVLAVAGGVLVVVTMVALLFGMSRMQHKTKSIDLEQSGISEQNTPVNTTQADPEADKASKLEWQKSKGVYDSGDYAVGEEIPAGTYVILSDGVGYGDFYCAVHTSPSMSDESELWFAWAQNSRYVILEEGQYLHFSHSTMYDPEKSEIVLDPYKSSGMFQVGRDIEPGTYTLTGTYDQGGGTYTIYSSLTSSGGVVRDGSYFEYGEEAEVTLYEGEYIETKHCQFKAEK